MAKKNTLIPTPAEVAEIRFTAIRKELNSKRIDALYINHLPSIRYLTGFSGSNGILIICSEKSWFFTDDRYTEQVKTEIYPVKALSIHIERDPLNFLKINNLLSEVHSLAFDPSRITDATLRSIKKNLSGISLKRLSGIVEKQTMIKYPHEIELIRKAGDIQFQVFQEILPLIKPGVRECDLAAEITYRGRKLGAEKESFDIIAVAGDHSAWVHGRASERAVNLGEMIIFDFGFYYQGFASDVTRTVACGEPGKEARKVYEIVRQAHASAIAASKADVNAASLDMTAREIIGKAGYADYFQHSLGHGLGIEVHESPAISFRNTKGKVPQGTVITIEPGIYLPGKFGVRIEDDIWITPDGCEILSTGSSELIVV